VHICQHYTLYQELCKEANIPVHHWAIPHPIWNKAKESQKHGTSTKQGTLDLVVVKLVGPQGFSQENLLHVVTQFITIDNQVRLTFEVASNI